MSRTVLMFRLSDTSLQRDLLREFEMHEGVVARLTDGLDDALLVVETADSQAAIWDVRATVGHFDEAAVEVPDVPDDQRA